MQQAKVFITLYSNTRTEQVKMFLGIVAKIVPLLLTTKPKHTGREGGGMRGQHLHKEEAYWTVERE